MNLKSLSGELVACHHFSDLAIHNSKHKSGTDEVIDLTHLAQNDWEPRALNNADEISFLYPSRAASKITFASIEMTRPPILQHTVFKFHM